MTQEIVATKDTPDDVERLRVEVLAKAPSEFLCECGTADCLTTRLRALAEQAP